ncbi:hypothetical protein LINPERPRIM_LOCUS18967 [Linum perenne]
MAVNTWNYLGFPTSSAAWRGPLKEWIGWGLEGDSSLLFGITAWFLWKARNELIFSNKISNHCQLAECCCNWARSVTDAFNRDSRCLNTQRSRRWVDVEWDPGPSDGVTINTDGSFMPSLNKASAGGIIRSADGRGLVAFTMNLGQCTITRAEMRGVIAELE